MSDTPFHLTKKNILITGASSGIGRQCAIHCCELGANVVLLGRNQERLAETKELLPVGSQSISFSVDLTSFDTLSQVFKDAVEKMGPLDGLIHCAGISTTLPLRALKTEKVEHLLRTNVTTAVELSRLFTKKAHLSASGGSIVWLSSVMGMVGEVGKTAYSLSKGALLAGAKSLALELAAKNVRVNCVSPGVVKTPMSDQAVYSQSTTAREKITERHPLGLGHPEDVAHACTFLLSDAAGWITGVNLPVDGGYTAH